MTQRSVISGLFCLALVALTASSVTSGSPHAIADPRLASVLANYDPAPRVQPELSVSAGGDHRPVVLHTCEAEGEAALARLAQTAALEEAFAFVPELCAWIDVGSAQEPRSVRVDRQLLDDLAMAFGRIAIYHIHPRSSDERALYFPAYADLLGVILINARHRTHPTVEIRHRAVTPLGAIEYSYHPSERADEILAVIDRTGLAAFAGENLSMAYRGPDEERLYYDAVRDCIDGNAESPSSGCFPLVAGDFHLELRSVAP